MVWGTFYGTKKSDMVFILGKAKLDLTTYVETLREPHLTPFWHQCCEEYGWVKVVKDSAPGHKGFAIEYCELNEMDCIQWLRNPLV
jgi:hypothetical protein